MLDTPLVSVIVPTRNRSRTLKLAIASVREQTYPNIELIVVDDASEDDTQVVLEALRKEMPNLHTYRFEQRRGANAARNFAIVKASGVFVAGLDDDDRFLSERIARLVKAYDDRFAFISAHSCITDESGRQFREARKRTEVTLEDIYFANLVGNPTLAKRERLLEVGLYDERLDACQDYDLWLRLMRLYGNVKLLPDYLYIRYEGNDFLRITNSKKAFSGYWRFHLKYREYYSRRQRKYRLFVLYRIRRKRISFHTLFLLFSGYRPMSVLKYGIKSFLSRE